MTCEPCDVPVSKRHLDMLLAHMTLSDKPHLGAITEMSRAQDSVDMAEIVFGRETLDQHCVIMGNVNTNSLAGGWPSPRRYASTVAAARGCCGALHSLRRDGTGLNGGKRRAGSGGGHDGLCIRAAGSQRSTVCFGQLSVVDVAEIRSADFWYA